MRITKPKERWFKVPEDEDNARVLIRQIPPGERHDIMDKAFKQSIEYHTNEEGALVPVMNQTTDRKLDREQTVLKSVSAWENFFDIDETLMPCTPENVLRAAREIDGFVEFVNESRQKLEKDITTEERELEKN